MHVFLIAALTVDGFIAQATDQVSTAWTSGEDKKWFNARTKQAGVIVMGSSTYKTIGQPLPKRLNIVYSNSQPAQIIPEAGEHSETDLVYTNLEPKKLMAELKNKNYTEVAICGGSSVYTQFLKAGIIDTVYLTVEPILFGKGVGLLNESIDIKLQLLEVTQLSVQTLMLEYRVLHT